MQMLKMIVVGSHACSQTLGEVRHRFVGLAALSRWYAKRLQLLSHLGLRLEFMLLFQHGAQTCVQIYGEFETIDSSQSTQDSSLAASPVFDSPCIRADCSR